MADKSRLANMNMKKWRKLSPQTKYNYWREHVNSVDEPLTPLIDLCPEEFDEETIKRNYTESVRHKKIEREKKGKINLEDEIETLKSLHIEEIEEIEEKHNQHIKEIEDAHFEDISVLNLKIEKQEKSIKKKNEEIADLQKPINIPSQEEFDRMKKELNEKPTKEMYDLLNEKYTKLIAEKAVLDYQLQLKDKKLAKLATK